MDKNQLIGKNQKLPWGIIPEEQKHYHKTIQNSPVIIGRKTYETMKEKTLNKEPHYILTNNKLPEEQKYYNIHTFNSISSLLKHINQKHSQHTNIYVLGGRTIYKQFLDKNIIKEMILTTIKTSYDNNIDNTTQKTYFPNYKPENWIKILSKNNSKFKVHRYHKIPKHTNFN